MQPFPPPPPVPHFSYGPTRQSLHAEDDDVCDVADSRDFADRLRSRGVNVAFDTVPYGGHYDPMISEGIPRAIEWLKRQSP
jgi:predicted esterase